MLLFLFQYYYYTIYVSIWVFFLTRWQILLHWNHNNSFLQFPIRLSTVSFSLCKWQQYKWKGKKKKSRKKNQKRNNRAKKVLPFLSPHSSGIYLLLSIHLRHLAASEAYGTITTSRKCCTAYNAAQYALFSVLFGTVFFRSILFIVDLLLLLALQWIRPSNQIMENNENKKNKLVQKLHFLQWYFYTFCFAFLRRSSWG